MTLLDACVAQGLPVPAPLRTGAGAATLMLGDKPALLCPRLPGRHVLIPTTPQIGSLGRFIARLHASTTTPADVPSYPRDREWLERQAHAVLPGLPYLRQRLLLDALAEVNDLLGREDVARLPTGVIHGDLFRDNVLFNHLGLSGVLDFHHAAHGYRIYDLAVAANDWCVDSDGKLEPARLEALVSAYAAIRPLEAAELWHLPMFMLYSGLAFWLSRLVVAFEQRQGRADRAKDPEVFARIVAARRACPVYLDPCLVNRRVDRSPDRQPDQNVAASER